MTAVAIGEPNHLDGCCWRCAQPPLSWHRCWAQTIGHIAILGTRLGVEVCPCGGSRVDGGPWIRRNNRLAHDPPRWTPARAWEAAAGWLILPIEYAGIFMTRHYRREYHHD